MTNFDTPQYRLARAISDLAVRVKELEAFDNAIFEIKTTTGRPTARGNYHFCINTFDSTVEIYADGAWEDLIGAGGGGYTDEDAQDAVGNILTDTASIDFTYDDATPEITADVIPGGVDHDSLLNFVGNEHIDHTAVTLTAGDGLSGGGDISANRTFNVDMLGLEDLAAPAGDRILFYDDTAGKIDWLVPNDHLSTLGTDLNVDDDFLLNTGDQCDGNLIIDNTAEEAFLVRKDADGGDIFIVDTTNSDVNLKQLTFIDGGSSVDIVRDEDNMASDDANALATQQSIKAYVDSSGGGNCYIETGNYTGDGTTSHAVSLADSNLVAKHVIIIWKDANDGDTRYFTTNDDWVDDDASGRCLHIQADPSGSGIVRVRDNRIIALGTGSFTVDDDGSDYHPNQNGEVYTYTVWGTH